MTIGRCQCCGLWFLASALDPATLTKPALDDRYVLALAIEETGVVGVSRDLHLVFVCRPCAAAIRGGEGAPPELREPEKDLLDADYEVKTSQPGGPK